MEQISAKMFRLILIASMIALCISQDDWDQRCNPLCKCRWVSGKRTAECMRQDFTCVPNDIPSEVQMLDLTGNHIPYLSHNAFTTVNLVNLHKLVLRECELESIDTDTFNGLKIIIEIDLAMNKIKQIFPGTFLETQRLRILHLNDNSLEFLENGLFHHLIYLQKVILSNNHLTRIEDRTFRNLPSLQTLTLDGNNLTTMEFSTFKNLTKLNSLELSRNPWNCNCHLRQFRDWVLERNLYTRPTSCNQPANFAGKTWDYVTSEEFECRPKIEAGHNIQVRNDGVLTRMIKLWCRSLEAPRPQLSWVHGSRVVHNATGMQNGIYSYILTEEIGWLNLTILETSAGDEGDYICVAKSPGGSMEESVNLSVVEENGIDSIKMAHLKFVLVVAATFVLVLIAGVTGFVWYLKRQKSAEVQKSNDDGSDHGGLDDQQRSFIAMTSPGKPAAHGSYATEFNGTLLGSGSVFAVDGPRAGFGTLDKERHYSGRDLSLGTLSRGASSRLFPPDLLAFSGGRISPASEASTVPDNSRLTYPQLTGEIQQPGPFGSPAGPYPAGFSTLPHKGAGGATSPTFNSGLAAMVRQGYVTIPRKPREPSWRSSSPTSPTPGPSDDMEPIYDRLGTRTTADGSSRISLNKSLDTGSVSTARGRPLPRTPTKNPQYRTLQRSTPNILTSSPLDIAASEGALKWPTMLPDEMNNLTLKNVDCRTLGRKLPPRPPPKPEMRTPHGPLFEDEGEDGTEV